MFKAGLKKSFSGLKWIAGISELTDDNFADEIGRLYSIALCILGLFVGTISIFTQIDAGFINFLGLVGMNIIYLIGIFLIRNGYFFLAKVIIFITFIVAQALIWYFSDPFYLSRFQVWFAFFPVVTIFVFGTVASLLINLFSLCLYLGVQIKLMPKEGTITDFMNISIESTYWTFHIIEYLTALGTMISALYIFKSVMNRSVESVRKNKELIIESAKLMSLGEMAGNIAHEINNPLSIIAANNFKIKSLLKKNKFEDERVETCLDQVDKTVKRISETIKGLKNISYNEAGETYVFNIGGTIEFVTSIFKFKLDIKKIKFTVSGSDDVSVVGNKSQFAEVLINLLNNSVYAIKDKTNASLELRINTDSKFAYVHIIDNGDGIAQENLYKIFEPFFTTKPFGEGTGLGLSISRKIILSFGGSLECDRVGDKTIFTIKLKKDI